MAVALDDVWYHNTGRPWPARPPKYTYSFRGRPATECRELIETDKMYWDGYLDSFSILDKEVPRSERLRAQARHLKLLAQFYASRVGLGRRFDITRSRPR